MGDHVHGLVDYFESCRSKRNITDYDRAGEISKREAEELVSEVRVFKEELIKWVAAHHPNRLL